MLSATALEPRSLRPSTVHYVAAAAVGILCWSWYSRAVGFGPAGWWAYPRWWHPFLPSYFQIGALAIPVVLLAVLRRVFPPSVDFSLATVIAAVTVFPQDPSTDVAFITLTLPFQIAFFLVGCFFANRMPPRLRRFGALLFPALLSVAVALIAILFLRGVYDAESVFRIGAFFVLHLGVPAQITGLLLERTGAGSATASTA